MKRAGLALVLAGCDTVLGLQRVPPPQPVTIAGTLIGDYAENMADGTPMLVEHVYEPSEVTLVATFADGRTAPVAYDRGAFSFEMPELAPYRLAVATRAQAVEYQLQSPLVALALRSAARFDTVLATQPTPVQVTDGPTKATGGVSVIASSGVWTFTSGLSQDTLDFNLDWMKANGTPGLLDAGRHDRLFVGEIDLDSTLAYYAFTRIAASAVTMTDGQSINVSDPLVDVPQNLCAHVIALRTQERARLDAAIPPGTYNKSVVWAIYAIPARELGPIGLLRLALGTNITTGGDTDLQVQFANPFPGTTLIAQLGATAAFTPLLPGTTAGPLFSHGAFTFELLDVSNASCIANLASLTGTVAIPQALALAGTPLDSDGKVVTLDPNADAEMTWTATSTDATQWSLDIFELSASGATTTARLVLAVVTDRAGSAVIGRGTLLPGHAYIARATGGLGHPDVASGDFVTTTYPYATGMAYSKYFVVSAP